MNARRPSPWDVSTGAVAPPPWQGPTHVHRLLSAEDAAPEDPLPEEPAPAAPEEPLRKCSKCGAELPLTGRFFYRSKARPGGFRPDCKGCYEKLPCNVRQKEREAAGRKTLKPPAQELEAVAACAARAVVEALPPWTLIEPGSQREELLRKVPARVWWQAPERK